MIRYDIISAAPIPQVKCHRDHKTKFFKLWPTIPCLHSFFKSVEVTVIRWVLAKSIKGGQINIGSPISINMITYRIDGPLCMIENGWCDMRGEIQMYVVQSSIWINNWGDHFSVVYSRDDVASPRTIILIIENGQYFVAPQFSNSWNNSKHCCFQLIAPSHISITTKKLKQLLLRNCEWQEHRFTLSGLVAGICSLQHWTHHPQCHGPPSE